MMALIGKSLVVLPRSFAISSMVSMFTDVFFGSATSTLRLLVWNATCRTTFTKKRTHERFDRQDYVILLKKY